MKIWAWIGGIALVVAGAVGWAATHQETVLIAIARTQLPHIEPNRPVSWAEGPATTSTGDRPPNVLLILADDMGFNDITFNGGGIAGGQVPTPNIDSIGH